MNQPQRRVEPAELIQPFPRPGPAIQLAYRELDDAENGTPERQLALGRSFADLPRPWAPATCTAPQLRAELWTWLDAVVVWINHELVFDPADVIPACWPRHPHLVHELAILADLHRRADRALISVPLEEWHRSTLPTFLERMRARVADHCAEVHPSTWPAAGRFNRHLSEASASARTHALAEDIKSLQPSAAHDDANQSGPPRRIPHLRVVDAETGELL